MPSATPARWVIQTMEVSENPCAPNSSRAASRILRKVRSPRAVLGAFPAPVPHTRPVRLAATATDRDLITNIGFVPGTMDVPSGVQGALERAFAAAAIPAVTVWARVPHYVAGMPYPAASAALLDGLAELADQPRVPGARLTDVVAVERDHAAREHQPPRGRVHQHGFGVT